MKNAVVILAAGEGTRMKSSIPKVLHKAAGRALVEWAVCAAEETGAKPIVVYGSGGNAVPEALGERAIYALQTERRGSGHAVMAAEAAIRESGAENVAIIAGDMPLIRAKTLGRLFEMLESSGKDAAMLTGRSEDSFGYGRILRDSEDNVVGIVEEKDATAEQKLIKEINISFYAFKTSALLSALPKIKPNNVQGEYYLTDVIGILAEEGGVYAEEVEDMSECVGANDRAQLADAEAMLRRRINTAHMKAGVRIIDPASTYIDADVVIEKDATIYPSTILEGKTVIGEGAEITGGRIKDTVVGAGARVLFTVADGAKIGAGTQVGPYTYLRPKTVVGEGCRIGDFVETKNCTIGDGTKVSHLTYVGDADVGSECNIGCGVVFVNYDGEKKTRTAVGDEAFIGCNTNLISPVNVGDGAYIAAGATVTVDVPEDSLLIARARETIKPGKGRGRYRRK